MSRKKKGGRNRDNHSDESLVGSCILSIVDGNFSAPENAGRLLEDSLEFAGLSVVDGRQYCLDAERWLHVYLLEESHAALHVISPSRALFEIYSCRPIEGEPDFELKLLPSSEGLSVEVNGVYRRRISPLKKLVELAGGYELCTHKFPIVVKIPDSRNPLPFRDCSPSLESYEDVMKGSTVEWEKEYMRYLRKWSKGAPSPLVQAGKGTQYFAAAVLHRAKSEDLSDMECLSGKFCSTVSAFAGIEEFWDFSAGQRYSAIAYGSGCFHAIHSFAGLNSAVITSNSPGRGEISCGVISRMAGNIAPAEKGKPIIVYSMSRSLDINGNERISSSK